MKDQHLITDVQLTLENEREFMEQVLYPAVRLTFKKKPFDKDRAIIFLSRKIQAYIRKCYNNEKCRYSYFYGFKPTDWKAERLQVATNMIESAIEETKLNGYIFDEPFNPMEN